MTLQELAQKRAKLLHDAQALMLGVVSAETRTQASAMLADADVVTEDITLLTRALQMSEAENRSAAIVPRGEVTTAGGVVAPDTRSVEQRKKDLNVSLRNFIRTGAIETRDLTVAADGIFIPTAVTDPNVASLYAGSIYDLVRKLPTDTGEPVKVPFLNDTAQGFVLNSASITTTDPTVAGITISIDDMRSNPILLENSLIQDASFDLVSFVNEAIATRYVRTVSNWITNGNTSNVTAITAGSTGITGGTTLVTAYADLVSLLVTLDPSYVQGAAWVMNNNTLGAVLKIVDSNLRPIFLPYADGPNSGFVGTLLGYPVKLNPYAPNNALNAKYIQFGNFRQGYCLREVNPGIMIKSTTQRYIELNKLGIVAFARVGGAATDAGTHPIVTLTGK